MPQALLSFAVVAALLTIIPGLDTTLVLRAALTRDRRTAAATAAGIATGSLVWGVAAAVGASALLGAIWFAGIIVATGAAGRWLRNARSIRVIDRITGTVLIGFGLRLALQPR